MQAATPVLKEIVLVGGGHTHVSVLRMFGMRPEPGVRLTMVSKESRSVYSGMFPGYIEGLYTSDECHIDLRPLCRFANARLIVDSCCGVDLARREVKLSGRPGLKYDVLSIDIGITPAVNEVPGATEHAVPVKPIAGFNDRWLALQERIRETRGKAPLRVVIVGGGAGGVEMALAMRSAVDKHRSGALAGAGGDATFAIVTRGEILGTHNARARRLLVQALKDRAIRVVEGAGVREVTPQAVVLEDGRTVPADEVVWCTQAAPQGWLADIGLDTDGGFVRVDPTLESTSHPSVFAAGDCASVVGYPRPKAGVYAVRQGPPLAYNLRAKVLGKPLWKFKPQSSHLGLISFGGRVAMASKGGIAFGGAGATGSVLWRWKDYIDRKFMQRFSVLPDMEKMAAARARTGILSALFGFGGSASARSAAPSAVAVASGPEALALISASKMRCGGCGAKVGATTLSRALSRVEVPTRPEVVVGVESADDAAVVRVPDGYVSVQTVDFFRTFLDDPYTLGRVAAVHALGDCWAMGAEPVAALAIAQVPFGLEDTVEEDLYQMMSGAAAALREAKCALAGGHSCEGQEMALGFSVHGAVRPGEILRKSGLAPGHALILTKPVGTGVIFAADMRAKASGQSVEAALASMVTQSGAAAAVLRAHGAAAATDVTGFGLLGHLRLGVASSLAPANVRLGRGLESIVGFSTHGAYPLIYDPQTAGGLLASVPADRASAAVAALRSSGYPHAAVVGAVLPGRAPAGVSGGSDDGGADWWVRLEADESVK